MNDNDSNAHSTSTREKLLETAKHLFYLHGYADTTLAKISAASQVNNGLITYYFGSKNNLASEIYTAFIINVRSELSRQLFLLKSDYTIDLAVAVETRFMQALKIENKNFMRFYMEYAAERSSLHKPNEKREHYYELLRQMINPNLSDADLRLYETCGPGIMRSIAAAFLSGYIPCDQAYMEDYTIRTLFRMLQLPPYQIEALVEESRYYCGRIKLKVGENFNLIVG